MARMLCHPDKDVCHLKDVVHQTDQSSHAGFKWSEARRAPRDTHLRERLTRPPSNSRRARAVVTLG
jgi:hypothetical protein